MTAFKRIRSQSGTVHYGIAERLRGRIETFCDMNILLGDAERVDSPVTCKWCEEFAENLESIAIRPNRLPTRDHDSERA